MEQGNRFTVHVHLHGTLAANAQGAFRVPCACSLVEASACAGNDSDATLIVGTAADDNGFCTAQTIGDGATPKVLSFDGALVTPGTPPHLADNTVFSWGLDFDGAGGTAAAHVSILFTFTEG